MAGMDLHLDVGNGLIRLIRRLACAAALLPASVAASRPARAQEPACHLLCAPRILLEPAAVARDLDRRAGDVDFLARVHIMIPTSVPRLGVSLATQWIVPHGSEPTEMIHVMVAGLQRPIRLSALLGAMNREYRGAHVWRPMAALYVRTPAPVPAPGLYGLGTLFFADRIVPSLAVGASVLIAPWSGIRKGK